MFFFCLFFFFFLGWKDNGSAQPNEDFESKESAETKMEVDIVCVWIHWSCCVSRLRFSIFFFFFFFVTLKRYCSSLLWTVAVTFDREQCICALFMDPQITLFNNFFIKNGSHGTIYTFKNYFATVFSVFSFQFQQNKFYSNRPIEVKVSDDTSQSENEED